MEAFERTVKLYWKLSFQEKCIKPGNELTLDEEIAIAATTTDVVVNGSVKWKKIDLTAITTLPCHSTYHATSDSNS